MKILLPLALSLCMFQVSFGHGGQVTVPTDYVMPNRGPGPAPPGVMTPGRTAAPGPAGPATAASTGASLAMSPSNIQKSRSGNASATRKRKTGLNPGYERWEFWWELNKDTYMDLRSRLDESGNVSGSSTFLVGRGNKDDVVHSRRPSQETIRSQIVPSLLRLMEVDHPDILDSTVLALARITPAERGRILLPHIRNMLHNKYQSAVQSSTLSLGVLGNPGSARELYELMIDSEAGRACVGRHEVPTLVRSFAALSLGLIDAPESLDWLISVIQRAPKQDRDLKACAVTALGLMKNNPDRDKIVSFLCGLLNDKNLDISVRAQVPLALGKLGDRVALNPLVKAFKTRKQPDPFRQSCAIAMGLLAEIFDQDAVNLLVNYIRDGKDEQTRYFAFIALGQIGARDQDFETNQELHKDLFHFLSREIVKPSKFAHKTWSALAAALHCREQQMFRAELIDRIAYSFKEESNPSFKGAMAIALGLLNARSKAPMLLDDLRGQSDNSLKGYLCVSLGLMNSKSARDTIRNIAATEFVSWSLRLQSVVALGLLGDVGAVDLLVTVLQEGQTLSVTSSAARALGVIGDTSAVPPLLDVMKDEEAHKIARAFAAVALGIIGEKTGLPWYAAIRENYNYRVHVPAIEEILTLL